MSSAPTSTDAFACVSTALLAVWPTVADPVAGPSKAELGRVLDECGSDHRPMVELLLDLGRVVRPALQGLPPQASGAWANTRAPLVHKLVATRWLQPDVARWAVDVWGRALGVAPPPASPVLELATAASEVPVEPRAVSAAPTAARTVAPAPVRGQPTTPPIVTPQQVPANLRNRPSWAGGPVSFGVGQKPSAAAMAALARSGRVVVQAPVTGGPRFQPVERRAAAVLVGLLVVITVGLSDAFDRRPNSTTPVDAVSQASLSPVAGLNVPAPSGDANAVVRVLKEQATVVPPAATRATEEVSVPGRVNVPPAAVTATPVAPTPDVSSSPRGSMSPLPHAIGERIRETGVAGRYRVTQHVRDVSGSESCAAVARALRADRESEEVVAHEPGASTFTLVTRGVTGTLDPDGWFVGQPRAGTTNNVNWQFRMRGRFGPDGFTGESVTHTDAILRWGRTQICVVTAELTGRRLPG